MYISLNCAIITIKHRFSMHNALLFANIPSGMTNVKHHVWYLYRLKTNMSYDMRLPTMWYVRPAKPQISLRIRAVWSEPLLVALIFYGCLAADWTSFGVSKLKRRLHRLVWVYTCQNTTFFKITCRSSYTLQSTFLYFTTFRILVENALKTQVIRTVFFNANSK